LAHLRGEAAEATARLHEALALLRPAGHAWGVAAARHVLGLVAMAAGDTEEAERRLRESLETRERLGEQRGVAECLEGLAAVAVARAERARAARLLGAAARLREAIGAPAPPVGRPSREEIEQAARAALGADAVAAAWAAGQALPRAEVVAGALGRPTGDSSDDQDQRTPPVESRTPLTTRELAVADLVARGLTSHEIAAELKISTRTVEHHVSRILRKLGFASRAQIAVWTVTRGR
jgi:non-specific serine/threonine protein kinase